jgi:hypothetical protein
MDQSGARFLSHYISYVNMDPNNMNGIIDSTLIRILLECHLRKESTQEMSDSWCLLLWGETSIYIGLHQMN